MGRFPDKAKLKKLQHTAHIVQMNPFQRFLKLLFDLLCSTCVFRRGDSQPKLYRLLRRCYAGDKRSNVCITVTIWYCVHVLQVITIASSCSKLSVSDGIVAPFDRKPMVQDYVSLSLQSRSIYCMLYQGYIKSPKETRGHDTSCSVTTAHISSWNSVNC